MHCIKSESKRSRHDQCLVRDGGSVDEVLNEMIRIRDEMVVLIKKGYGHHGVREQLAQRRDALDALRDNHPEQWKKLPKV